jgi:hypothetical protein
MDSFSQYQDVVLELCNDKRNPPYRRCSPLPKHGVQKSSVPRRDVQTSPSHLKAPGIEIASFSLFLDGVCGLLPCEERLLFTESRRLL